jgi:hypothetical protein
MTCVVHDTPGHIDLRAFMTFGVNAKPGARSPIGFFGTGLKYAVAVLCREGCNVTVWVGDEPHVFYTDKVDFRGKEFLQLRMKRKRGVTARWMSQELPFTTELGKNWKIWMALRELHSNTLDENGVSYLSADDVASGLEGSTRIVVSGDAYVTAFAELDKIFLKEATDAPGYDIVRHPGPSKVAYYRGLRAHDLERESLYTWDLRAEQTLTEDRTLKYGFMVEYYVRHHVMASKDKILIKTCLEADENTLEGSVNWREDEKHYCSSEFLEGVKRWGKPKVKYVFVEREPAKPRQPDWGDDVLRALDSGDRDDVADTCLKHRDALTKMLAATRRSPSPEASAVTDDIPF